MIFHARQIQAGLFDMDGTLFDTERLRFSTLRQASTQLHGQPIDNDLLVACLGLSARKAEQLARNRYGEDYPYPAIRQRADELELAYVRKYGVPIKDGVFDVLERLKRSGLLLAVATSSRRAIAEEYLLNANVLKYFDIIVCGDEVKRGKPHPEIFLDAARQLNCDPAYCLAFEDSENGLTAAADAGTLPILIKDIKTPRPAIRERAFRYYESLAGFLDDMHASVATLGLPALTEAFPQTRNGLQVGIHGFGAIGGGYLTQIFSHWDGYTRPSRIIGASGNRSLRQLVNVLGRFKVSYPDRAFEQTIDSLHLIDLHDPQAMTEMYRDSVIIGLCLPESAIRQQAELIGHGLAERFAQPDAQPLTILVLLNKIAGARFTRTCVRNALLRTHTAEDTDALLGKVRFVETVVSRIVSRTAHETLLKHLRLAIRQFEQHLQDSGPNPHHEVQLLQPRTQANESLDHLSARLGQLSPLAEALAQLDISLFSSDPVMPLHAERGDPLLDRLRQVTTVDDISPLQQIKNRLLNGPHTIIAWYASLLGYQNIGQGMGDERVMVLVRQVVNHEIKPALLAEYPHLGSLLNTFANGFIKRCQRSFRDPCQRVARDPLRKLQRRERILASLDLAHRHGIATPMLEYGIALGIRYAVQAAPPQDKECQTIRQLYQSSSRVEHVLTYQGEYAGQPYPGLDGERDRSLIARIAAHFNALRQPDSAHWDWPLRQP